MAKAKIELGKKYRDKTTGAEGMAVTKTIYLNGCVYYMLNVGHSETTGKILRINTPEQFLEEVGF